MESWDVVVVGAGYGGLGAALGLAERGARVRLHEALTYPGGCAATVARQGARFDVGATLSTGLGPGELFETWIRRYALPVSVVPLDPALTYRGPGLTLALGRDRAAVVDALCALPDAPAAGIRAYFAHQAHVADALWPLFSQPDLLPPLSWRSVLAHAARAPTWAGVVGVVGRPWAAVLARHGIDRFGPVRRLLDALGQITVQAGAEDVEAPVAMAAADLPWRGAAHVRGGIGRLAEALVDGARAAGAEVRLADRVTGLRRVDGGWRVQTRSGEVSARAVVLNLVPEAARRLLGASGPRLDALADEVAGGWSAATRYVVLDDDPALPRDAAHAILQGEASGPATEGRQVFASLSEAGEPDRAAPGQRVLTLSTHVPLRHGRDPAQVATEVQDRMTATVAARWPELARGVVAAHPASARTWARFTRRPEGAVGGPIRKAGLSTYLHAGPEGVAPGAWLVGDAVFPGQGTLACALGGVRVAEAVARALGAQSSRIVQASALR